MLEHAPSVTKWALCGRRLLTTWSKGRATLLGDACHTTLPFLAQGAVHTIEDAVVLARCLEKYADVPTALGRYDEVRRPRAHRMVRVQQKIPRASITRHSQIQTMLKPSFPGNGSLRQSATATTGSSLTMRSV